MCSVNITLKQSDGGVQKFSRTVETGGGDTGTLSDLATLRKHMGEIQTEVNAAITVVVDKEKATAAASGKVQNRKEIDDQEDEDDEDDDDDTNGFVEPPEKIRKT